MVRPERVGSQRPGVVHRLVVVVLVVVVVIVVRLDGLVRRSGVLFVETAGEDFKVARTEQTVVGQFADAARVVRRARLDARRRNGRRRGWWRWRRVDQRRRPARWWWRPLTERADIGCELGSEALLGRCLIGNRRQRLGQRVDGLGAVLQQRLILS